MNSAGRILRRVPVPGRGGTSGGGRGWSPSPSTKRMFITALVIAVVFAFIYFTATFWVQWWWFDSVGYQSALITRYVSAAVAFVVSALLVGGFFAVNWQLALRRGESAGRSARLASSRILRWPLWLLTIAIGLFAGWTAGQQWGIWRLAFAGQSFGVADPIFGMDAGFYVFLLPAIELVHQMAIVTVIVTLAATGLIYLGLRGLDRIDQLGALPRARRHVLVLAALLLLLFGIQYVLANYDLQYSTRGFANGPSFTDVTVVRPLNYLLALVSVAAALVLVFSRRTEQLRWLAVIAIVWVAAVGIGAVVPGSCSRRSWSQTSCSGKHPTLQTTSRSREPDSGWRELRHGVLAGKESPRQASCAPTRQFCAMCACGITGLPGRRISSFAPSSHITCSMMSMWTAIRKRTPSSRCLFPRASWTSAGCPRMRRRGPISI